MKLLLDLKMFRLVLSLPTWECGLKRLLFAGAKTPLQVAPHVGVWIETDRKVITFKPIMSLPTWECGLKLVIKINYHRKDKSLPTWECGLKRSATFLLYSRTGRSPRGSVD